jgi:drug/metabolite transporter (DMT)-like permease
VTIPGLSAARGLSPDLRGILMMCAAMAAFTVNDALMKAALQTVPLMEAIAIRGVLAFSALLVLALATGNLVLRIGGRDARLLGWRMLAEVGSTLTFLAALTHMSMANLSALLQSLPLAVALAAALFLGERVTGRQWLAIAGGFVGVLLIVRPGTAGFDQWSLLGLLSVAMVVVRDLTTRQMSRGLPTLTVAASAAGSVALAGAAGALVLGEWTPVPAVALAQIAAAAACLVLGYMTIVQAMRQGDIARVAPFRYSALVWAIVLGWLVFGALPDGWTWAGAALIVVSGIVSMTYRR